MNSPRAEYSETRSLLHKIGQNLERVKELVSLLEIESESIRVAKVQDIEPNICVNCRGVVPDSEYDFCHECGRVVHKGCLYSHQHYVCGKHDKDDLKDTC